MTVFTHALSTNNYGAAKFVVSSSAANGTHTTISAALAVASSGDIIQVRPGTYTENLTIPSGVTLAGFGNFANNTSAEPIIVNGQITLSGSGNYQINGLNLISNGADLISLSGSNNQLLEFINCQFENQAANTYTIITCSNANCTTTFNTCSIVSRSSTAKIFNITNGGFNFSTSVLYGISATSTITAGTFALYQSGWPGAFTTSGTASFLAYYSTFFGNTNVTITLGGSGTHQAYYCIFSGGTAPALTVNTTLVNLESKIISSNASAIAGSGTISYDSIAYSGTSSTNSVTTQTHVPVQNGGWSLISTQTASASASLIFTNLPVYKVYAVVFNALLPATNAQDLELLVSTDNGSTYANSGYNGGITYNAYNANTWTNATATTYGIFAKTQNNGIGLYGTAYLTPGNGGWWGQMSFYIATYELGLITGSSGVIFNAFKFQFASGNITSGSISVYGINS